MVLETGYPEVTHGSSRSFGVYVGVISCNTTV
jgi:hypothetical protein